MRRPLEGARPLPRDNASSTTRMLLKGANKMEFLVVIDAQSLFGKHLLTQHGKIGGASGLWTGENKETHPVIVGTGLSPHSPGLLQLTHLQDPGHGNQAPRQVLVPANTVLVALEHLAASKPPAAQQSPTGPLH